MDASAHILLTGGTGFFGRALLRSWREAWVAGDVVPQVTVVSRSPSRFQNVHPQYSGLPWLRFHDGNVCRPASLPTSGEFSHVMHMATESTLGPRLTPLQRYTEIVDGTRHLLEFAVARGVRRFLLTSSGAVYGPQPADLERIPEDWSGSPPLLVPSHAYGLGKRAAEHLCMLYRDAWGLEPVIARCFAFVGPDLPLDAHFAIGNFIRDALAGRVIEVEGDGSPLRTYLDQDDLAEWLLTLLECGRAGEPYNVGSDEVVSIGGLAHLVRNVLAPAADVNVQGRRSDSMGRSRYVPDVRKAASELGLRVRVPLVDALRRTGEYHRNRGKW